MTPLWYYSITPIVLADADAQDIFKIIAFVFAGLWFVLKLATDRIRQGGAPPGGRPPVPQPRLDVRPQSRPSPPAGGDPRDEVAEFLRRAQMSRGNAPARPPKPPNKKPQKKQERRSDSPSRSERKPERPKPSTGLSSIQPPAGAPGPPDAKNALGGFSGPHLTDEANQALGSYAGLMRSDAVAIGKQDVSAVTGTASSDVLALFADADKLQQAFILAEILQPPRDRFE